MGPLPEFELHVYTCQPQRYRADHLSHCSRELRELRELRASTDRVIKGELSPLIQYFDPLPALCDLNLDGELLCSMIDDQGLPLYRDRDHLSRHGAQRLSPMLKQWVSSQ
jgi:lysophospholipase L1-like esterase